MKVPTPPRLPFGLPWFPVIVVGLLLAAFLLTRPAGEAWGGFGRADDGTSAAAASTRTTTASPSRNASASPPAVPTCEFSSLPVEASATAQLVRAGGPYPYPRNDGVVFHNNSKLLPIRRDGYYREYTVATPGSRTRGERRLVTGGTPLASPPQWYYTGDHYESFCAISGAQ